MPHAWTMDDVIYHGRRGDVHAAQFASLHDERNDLIFVKAHEPRSHVMPIHGIHSLHDKEYDVNAHDKENNLPCTFKVAIRHVCDKLVVFLVDGGFLEDVCEQE